MMARLDEDLRATPALGLRVAPPLGHITVMSRILLPDLAATTALAAGLAALTRPGDSLLLEGPLGAGKTTFARAFLRAASGEPTLDVPSPSFTLVQIYDTKIGPIFHYDLWRVDNANALTELDWDDARDAIVLVEWPDRLGERRPTDGLTITFHLGLGQAREVMMAGWGGRIPTVFPVSWPDPLIEGDAASERLATAPSASQSDTAVTIEGNTATPAKQ